MRAALSLCNWIIWLLIAPAVTFILSLVFQFSYLECVQSGPYAMFYALYFILASGMYVASTQEDDRPMDFI